MLPILVFVGALICLANLLGLALFALSFRRQAKRQRELLQRTRSDFQDALNQVLDRYQDLRAEQDLEDEEDLPQATGRETTTPEATRRISSSAERPVFETIATTLPALPTVGAGINFGKRTQILRLYRQGEGTAEIGAAVGVPRAEVELVIKMHNAVQAAR